MLISLNHDLKKVNNSRCLFALFFICALKNKIFFRFYHSNLSQDEELIDFDYIGTQIKQVQN